jgi:hypothetical protein
MTTKCLYITNYQQLPANMSNSRYIITLLRVSLIPIPGRHSDCIICDTVAWLARNLARSLNYDSMESAGIIVT